jgi:hypothetical protein
VALARFTDTLESVVTCSSVINDVGYPLSVCTIFVLAGEFGHVEEEMSVAGNAAACAEQCGPGVGGGCAGGLFGQVGVGRAPSFIPQADEE